MELRLLALALAAAATGFVGDHGVEGFYLPGVAPVTFDFCDNVDVKVNKLTSVHTQLPLDYYAMPFCTWVRFNFFHIGVGLLLSINIKMFRRLST